MLEENVNEVFEEIKNGNNFGEKITLVAAGKTIDAGTLNRAVKLGVTAIGDNRVQEFRDKSPLIDGATFHFIGRLQKNKVKYLVGKVTLIQSVGDIPLAEEIDKQSAKKGCVTDVLVEVNVGREESKGGFLPEQVENCARVIATLKNVRVKGLMAVLPKTDDERIAKLCLQMRAIYDKIKAEGLPFEYLSVGMSGDYRIAVKNGSNMIRLGTRLFGERNYTKG